MGAPVMNNPKRWLELGLIHHLTLKQWLGASDGEEKVTRKGMVNMGFLVRFVMWT